MIIHQTGRTSGKEFDDFVGTPFVGDGWYTTKKEIKFDQHTTSTPFVLKPGELILCEGSADYVSITYFQVDDPRDRLRRFSELPIY